MNPETPAARQHLSTAWLVAIVVVGLAATTPTSAQTVSLVRDINTGNGIAEDGFHRSGTAGLLECGSFLYFVGEAKDTGKKLWKTDGTEAGTELVLDRVSYPYYTACANSNLLYAQSELWTTDGTSQGTAMVKDINPGSGASYPKSLTGIGGLVYFQANDGVNGDEPWVSDGTEAGTVMLNDINPGTGSSTGGSTEFFEFGGYVYFSADSNGYGEELWRTDGTPAGTSLFKSISQTGTGSNPRDFTDGGSFFYFVADDGVTGSELWKSDGTDSGTVLVANINQSGGSYPDALTMMGSRLYFAADDGRDGIELWRSTGTSSGTRMVADINPTGGSFPWDLHVFDGRLYFAAEATSGNRELWTSTGSASGTVQLADINPSGSSDPFGFTTVNGEVLFRADDGSSGSELWKTDGTATGTVQVRDINLGSGSSSPYHLTARASELFFCADNGPNGTELWRSDATATGTVMVKNIYTEARDSDPSIFFEFDGKLFFSAATSSHGTELWTSDGTTAGTVIFKDIRSGSGSSSPYGPFDLGGTLLFGANGSVSQGSELWTSDGTSAGTVLVKDIRPGGSGSNLGFFSAVPGGAVFRADDGSVGSELWFTNATEVGTSLLKDINAGSGSAGITNIESNGAYALFRGDNGTNGTELWVSNGTAIGTYLLKDIYVGASSSYPSYFTFVGGTAFFVADNGVAGNEIWKTDGTTTGTVIVKDLNPGAGDGNFVPILTRDGILYFRADDGAHGSELWQTDGTEAGTFMVADLSVGPDGSVPSLLGTIGDLMVLEAKDAAHGRELWVSDGTASGTTFLADTLPGPDWSYHYGLASNDGFLYFANFEPETGLELWRTDGTTTGTAFFADVRPGPAGSKTHFNNSHLFGDQLFFAATTDAVGRELWKACVGVFYEDGDEDGSGNPNVTTLECSAPLGFVDNDNDCDDGEDTVFPGAVELCDVLDNDCDGRADEPDFAGLASAVLLPSVGCEVQLSWAAAGPAPCGGGVTYSVYRSMEDDFIPSAANRITSGLTGLTYTDAGAISPNGTYHYAVRATAAATDSEETNLVRLSVSLSGSGCTPSGPSPVAFFTARATDGEVLLEWLNPEFPYSHTQLCWSDSGYPASPFCDPWGQAGFGTPGDSDSAVPYAGVYNDTEYYFTSWIYYFFPGITGLSVPLHCRARPYSGPTEIPWVFSTGASSLAPTGIRPGEAIFTVSNDRSLHSVDAGVTGGRWSNEWKPVAMNGPAQARPAPVPFSTTTIGGAAEVIFVSSEDGHVYAFDTVSGRELWRSPKLGDTVVAATSGILTDFGGSQDVILVGSRTPTGDSKFYGLMLQTGAVDWVFDNGGGPSGIGLISGQAQVSYATNRVYFASRQKAGGSSDTLWCLELVGTSEEVQLVWARDLGDIDGSPILRGGVLYVGNNAGQVFAIDPTDGTNASIPYTPTVPDGAVKGFVWVDTTATPTRLYYSTTSSVHALVDDGVSVSQLWPAVSIASPSPLIIVGDGIWFGSTAENGSLRRIDKHTGAATNRTLLGDSGVPKTVGAPTYDIQPSVITVGTDEGRIYAVEIPSP